MRKAILAMLLPTMICAQIWAQETNSIYPEVGKPCPDFVLHNIKYYNKSQATLEDFKGKWLLLDFWNRVCGACIASFPRESELQKELGDKVQVMMVAIQDKGNEVNLLASKYWKKENLVMPCAFDSVLSERWDILTCPYSVLIDGNGVVQCITTSMHTDDMKKFLAGGHPKLPYAYRMHEDVPEAVSKYQDNYTPQKPFMIHDNGASDTDYLYRTMLSQWRPGYRARPISTLAASLDENKRGVQLLGNPLERLYFYAYFGEGGFPGNEYGKLYNHAILEMKDTSLFVPDFKTGKNIYSYSLEFPPAVVSVEKLESFMQSDLKKYFGYDVSIETRSMPCWKLIATKAAREKLRTKGGKPNMQGAMKVDYTAINTPFWYVLNCIRVFNPEEIVLDKSGITGNVDIHMGCDGCVLTDIHDVKKALQANGLDLVPTKMKMKVLVIRDKK